MRIVRRKGNVPGRMGRMEKCHLLSLGVREAGAEFATTSGSEKLSILWVCVCEKCETKQFVA